jgi:hypothetical protein
MNTMKTGDQIMFSTPKGTVKIGIVKDKTDRLIEEQANLTAQDNAFSPNFYRYAPAGSLLLTRAKAEQLANELFDALGYWYDDEAKVKGVFMQLKTKSQVSILSDIFTQLHKIDMLEFMRKGKGVMWQAGLNDEELSQIINLVNRLPKYKI